MTNLEIISEQQARLDIPKYWRRAQAIFAIVWLLIFFMPVIEEFYELSHGTIPAISWQKIWFDWKHILPLFLLFAVHDVILLPYLYARGKRALCIFWAVVAYVVYLYVMPMPPKPEDFANMPPGTPEIMFAPHPVPTKTGFGILLYNMALGIIVIFVDFSTYIYVSTLDNKKRLENLEVENTRFQLAALKYQINPHFFMNTLNNIQALIVMNPETARQAIQQLSKLMRYLLYESSNPEVALTKEIEFMNNYIDLMRLRYPENVRIDADLDCEGYGEEIPTLIFISFIENAFKYGVSYGEDSSISVRMGIKDDRLHFLCVNTIHPDSKHEHEEGGLGLRNIKRRLELLYGKDYVLDIKRKDNFYTVEMDIPIIHHKKEELS